MTNAQIEKHYDDLYEHFEYGGPAPEGVVIKKSLSHTVGRVWDYGDNGLFARAL